MRVSIYTYSELSSINQIKFNESLESLKSSEANLQKNVEDTMKEVQIQKGIVPVAL